MGLSLGGLFRGVTGIASVIPGPWQVPAQAASVGLGILSGGKAQKQSDALVKRALAMRNQEWERRAPLRDHTLNLATQPIPGREDLSSVYADPGNPYSRPVPRPTGPTPFEMPAPPIGPLPPAAIEAEPQRYSGTLSGKAAAAHAQRAAQRAAGTLPEKRQLRSPMETLTSRLVSGGDDPADRSTVAAALARRHLVR